MVYTGNWTVRRRASSLLPWLISIHRRTSSTLYSPAGFPGLQTATPHLSLYPSTVCTCPRRLIISLSSRSLPLLHTLTSVLFISFSNRPLYLRRQNRPPRALHRHPRLSPHRDVQRCLWVRRRLRACVRKGQHPRVLCGEPGPGRAHGGGGEYSGGVGRIFRWVGCLSRLSSCCFLRCSRVLCTDLDAIVLTTPSMYLHEHDDGRGTESLEMVRRTSGATGHGASAPGLHILLLLFFVGLLLARPVRR